MDLGKDLKKIFKKSKNDSGFSPEKDWKKIFLLFVALAILTVGVNSFVFLKIKSGEFFKPDSLNEFSFGNLNHNELEEVVNFFEAKNTAFQELRESRGLNTQSVEDEEVVDEDAGSEISGEEIDPEA